MIKIRNNSDPSEQSIRGLDVYEWSVSEGLFTGTKEEFYANLNKPKSTYGTQKDMFESFSHEHVGYYITTSGVGYSKSGNTCQITVLTKFKNVGLTSYERIGILKPEFRPTLNLQGSCYHGNLIVGTFKITTSGIVSINVQNYPSTRRELFEGERNITFDKSYITSQ